MTEIGEIVKDFWKNPSKRKPRFDRGGLNLFSMRDMNRLRKTQTLMPGATSGIIFNEARLPNKA